MVETISIAALQVTDLSERAAALYNALKDTTDTAPENHAKIIDLLKSNLAAGKDKIREKFESGNLSGIGTAAQISGVHDDILRALYKFTITDKFPQGHDESSDTFTLCAVGGYGRGEMAPFSDLDLLFLTESKSPNQRCEEMAQYILYMLWDIGLKVGHSIRTPDQCISLARQDETILTSMLDLRLLAGPPEIAIQLANLLRKERTRSKTKNYVSVKLEARDARHRREGNSRYVIEPNIKEGKGGLRDLHVLYWIARFIHGGKKAKNEAPDTPHGVSAYLRLGLLNEDAADRFTTAAEFLWKTRIHLHFLAGRPLEVLSFDRQDAMAVRMGYKEGSPEDRVEAFMRAYFTTTREVGALTRIACAKLESKSSLLLPQGLDRFLPTSRRSVKVSGFVLDHGRLDFANAKTLKKTPYHLLKLFEISGSRNLDIHPDAFASILENMDLIDDEFRSSEDAANIFDDILLKSKAPGAVLRVMNDAGVLGAYIPEFGDIVGSTQFNMHHAYTVDDHTLSLIHYLNDIEVGVFAREHPLSTDFTKNWSTRIRRMVYLACLFHDVGKGKGDQCIEGAKLAITACRRMHLQDADIETISWLVRNHLEMSETAQRRDISDPATVEKFAHTVGSVSRLQMLTALTSVDMRAVGPGIWNDWRGELMRQLYTSTQRFFMGDADESSSSPVKALMKLLPAETVAKCKVIFEAMPETYWQNFPIERQMIHADFFSGAGSAEYLVTTHLETSNDITELWVLTRDRPRLFADLSGAIASRGASIVGARLHTGEKPQESDATLVFNVFYLQNTEGLAFGRKNPGRLTDIETAASKAIESGMSDIVFQPALPSKRAAAIPIKSRVSIQVIDDETAMIELEGRDRIGLLHELANGLVHHNISMRSAHIEVTGPKAIDVFYVAFDGNTDIKSCGLSKTLLTVLKNKSKAAP